MNQEKFNEIVRFCDELLSNKRCSIERMSIPWLHVLNDHPNVTKQYASLEANCLHKRLQNTIIESIKLFLDIFRSLSFFKKEIYLSSKEISLPFDYLFISHIQNVNQINKKDPFYGDIPRVLADHGLNIGILYLDETGNCPYSICKKWSNVENITKIILEKDSLQDTLVSWASLRKERKKVQQSYKYETNTTRKKILAHLSKEIIKRRTRKSHLFYIKLTAFFSKICCKNIMTTYEGHPWERLTYFAAKTACQATCIGYQHAVLIPGFHALSRNLDSKFNPDKILTTGIVTKRMLENIGVPIFQLGTHKTLSAKTSYFSEKEHYCVVLPEGLDSECDLLLNFAYKLSIAAPHITFILRLHPSIDAEAVKKKINFPRNLPQNILFSTSTLEEDLSKSKWALYRGSSTAIQATLMGLRPIYLNVSEAIIDPLFEVSSWKKEVSAAEEAIDLFKKDTEVCGQELDEYQQQQEEAINYCRSYFCEYGDIIRILAA